MLKEQVYIMDCWVHSWDHPSCFWTSLRIAKKSLYIYICYIYMFYIYIIKKIVS